MKRALVLAFAAAGCVTARFGAGGHVVSKGGHGGDGTAGVGVGASWHADQALYAGGELGLAGDGGKTRIVAGGRVDYVNHMGMPWSLSLRFGSRVPAADDPMPPPSERYVGGTVAVFPFHNTPPEHEHQNIDFDDPSSRGKILDDMFGPVDGYYELGIALDVSAVEREGAIVTLDLVVELDTLHGRWN